MTDEVMSEKERDEARRKMQTEFDPKLHGVGTAPVDEPGSIKELYMYVKSLEERILSLESSRLRQLNRPENKPAAHSARD